MAFVTMVMCASGGIQIFNELDVGNSISSTRFRELDVGNSVKDTRFKVSEFGNSISGIRCRQLEFGSSCVARYLGNSMYGT